MRKIDALNRQRAGVKNGGRMNMSKEQMILLPKDAENLLLVYLIFKAVIIVFSHYLGFPWSIQ